MSKESFYDMYCIKKGYDKTLENDLQARKDYYDILKGDEPGGSELLQLACRYKHPEVIKVLIEYYKEHKLDPIEDKESNEYIQARKLLKIAIENALHYASYYQEDIIDELKTKGLEEFLPEPEDSDTESDNGLRDEPVPSFDDEETISDDGSTISRHEDVLTSSGDYTGKETETPILGESST